MTINKKSTKIYQNKKGNISILIIFILIASGLIWVLTMHFVQQMLHYNGTIMRYYKSYYLARGGLEMSLTQIHHRGVGFEYSIKSGDTLLEKNFDCRPNCFITTKIQWRSQVLHNEPRQSSECETDLAYTLNPWESLILPMFQDLYFQPNNSNVFTPIEYKNILSIDFRLPIDFKGWEKSDQMSISLVTSGFFPVSKIYKGTDINDQTIYNFLRRDFVDQVDIISKNKSLQPFLIIANPSLDDDQLRFCLFPQKSSKPIDFPLETAFITSFWSYANQWIWLEALYKHKALPNFLSHTTLGF